MEQQYSMGFYPYQKKAILYSIDDKGCWNCTSHMTFKGYPSVTRSDRRIKICRLILEHVLERRIVHPMQVNHACNNKLCINPEHLYEGTQKQNMEDCVKAKNHVGLTQKGDNHFQCKIKSADRESIRSSESGIRELAKTYGVSYSTIRRIQREARV